MAEKCKAHKRNGEPCNNYPVTGYKVCRLHGARGGPPKGNKNAVKTGQYETIYHDQLDPEEREIYGNIDTSALAQAREAVKLLTIREKRMLARIKAIQEEVKNMDPDISEGDIQAFHNYKSKHSRLLDIEAALTQIQKEKGKHLELIFKIESANDGPDRIPTENDPLIESLNDTALEVFEHEEV